MGKTDKMPSKYQIKTDKVVDLKQVFTNVYNSYNTSTSKKMKVLDSYLACILCTGIIQFVYCCIVGSFPFNSFLSGFISTVGCFVLAVCLRLQIHPKNQSIFQGISPEQAFADFILAHVILHLIVFNFMG